MDDYSFSLIESPTDEWAEAVNSELREFNRTQNPQFWAALERPERNLRPLNVLVFNSWRRVIGGLFAETRLSWLKINVLAVAADLRRQGIGAHLVALAEFEAVRRGCGYAFTESMDYQAPDFFRKLGYAIVGRINDWDSYGHAKLVLVKKLCSDKVEDHPGTRL